MAMNYNQLKSVPGFSWLGENIGIKDKSLDFGVIVSESKCSCAAVFTKNNLPGAPVIVGKKKIKSGQIQAVIVNSKNANVATGLAGIEDAEKMSIWAAEALGIDNSLVIPCSTGVIGQRLPLEKIRLGCKTIPEKLGYSAKYIENFSRAILTTDTYPKFCADYVGNSILLGIAKGSGMIEPNMATMLSFFVTDAQLSSKQLQIMLKRVVDKSFNRISIDSDTSTSDTVIILANGLAGPIDTKKFEETFTKSSIKLAKQIARDGEGASKLIELTVSGAKSQSMALQISKSIINSPLVKTAIHGADPNWGRFVMAIGKVFDYPVSLDDICIIFGNEDKIQKITANNINSNNVNLDAIENLLKQNEIFIEVIVGNGGFTETVWGCDLTKGYIEENAFYTT